MSNQKSYIDLVQNNTKEQFKDINRHNKQLERVLDRRERKLRNKVWKEKYVHNNHELNELKWPFTTVKGGVKSQTRPTPTKIYHEYIENDMPVQSDEVILMNSPSHREKKRHSSEKRLSTRAERRSTAVNRRQTNHCSIDKNHLIDPDYSNQQSYLSKGDDNISINLINKSSRHTHNL